MNNTQREYPRMSVNKLGEYITALPGRRKTIIKQQKRPQPFIVPYYRAAEDILVDYLTSSSDNEDWLELKIEELSSKSTTSDWDETRRNICIDALDSFRELVEELNFQGLSCTKGDPAPQKLDVAGVQISVRPEVYLSDSKGNAKGCIKLVFGKRRELQESEAGYIGTCLQEWMGKAHGVSDYKSCFVLDIFGEKRHVAPRAYVKRMQDITAACEEISRAWDNA